MCDCIKQMREKLKQAMPDATDIIMPVELLSGRVYIKATKICKLQGKQRKQRKEQISILLSKCPWCGEKQGG